MQKKMSSTIIGGGMKKENGVSWAHCAAVYSTTKSKWTWNNHNDSLWSYKPVVNHARFKVLYITLYQYLIAW